MKIGTFFMINLCLVVIANQFSETRRRETIKMKQEREEFSSESSFSSFTERCMFLSMKNLINQNFIVTVKMKRKIQIYTETL